MSIAVPVNASARVRELRDRQPHLTPAELASITGVPLKNVKAALQRRTARDKPKSRVS